MARKLVLTIGGLPDHGYFLWGHLVEPLKRGLRLFAPEATVTAVVEGDGETEELPWVNTPD